VGRASRGEAKGWRTGPPSYNPATQLLEIVALGPKVGGRHGPPPESVTGTGQDEAAAVRDLEAHIGAR
jgi:hypothetical protein